MRNVGKNANAQIFVINLFACIIWEGSRHEQCGVRYEVVLRTLGFQPLDPNL